MIFMVDVYGEEAFNLDDIECFRISRYGGDYQLCAITNPNHGGMKKNYVITLGDKKHCNEYLKSRLNESVVLDTER